MTSIRKSLPSRKVFGGRSFDIDERTLDAITNQHAAEHGPRKPLSERRSHRRREKVKEAKNKTKLRLNKRNLAFSDESLRQYTFEGTQGTQKVVGDLIYDPKSRALSVTDIGDNALPGAENMTHSELHDKVKNRAMSRRFTRDLLAKAAKSFPNADTLSGFRVTGAHNKATRKALDDVARERAKTGKKVPEPELKAQSFNLARMRAVASRIGKASKLLSPFDPLFSAMEMRQGEKIREQRLMREGLIPGKT